jgi:hypothetical protein
MRKPLRGGGRCTALYPASSDITELLVRARSRRRSNRYTINVHIYTGAHANTCTLHIVYDISWLSYCPVEDKCCVDFRAGEYCGAPGPSYLGQLCAKPAEFDGVGELARHCEALQISLSGQDKGKHLRKFPPRNEQTCREDKQRYAPHHALKIHELDFSTYSSGLLYLFLQIPKSRIARKSNKQPRNSGKK